MRQFIQDSAITSRQIIGTCVLSDHMYTHSWPQQGVAEMFHSWSIHLAYFKYRELPTKFSKPACLLKCKHCAAMWLISRKVEYLHWQSSQKCQNLLEKVLSWERESKSSQSSLSPITFSGINKQTNTCKTWCVIQSMLYAIPNGCCSLSGGWGGVVGELEN